MPGTATGKQNGKIHRKEMQKNMAYMKPDPNLDLNTTEGRREQLRQLLGSRAQKIQIRVAISRCFSRNL